MTYKKFFANEENKFERTGYSPGVAVIGDLIVGIENRDGNTNVRFQDMVESIFSNLEQNNIHFSPSKNGLWPLLARDRGDRREALGTLLHPCQPLRIAL